MTYANKMIKQSPQKLELLESLRGIAALLIVAFHAAELFALKFDQPFLLSLFDFGDSGVDFFFVLSGFFLALSSFKYMGHRHTAKAFLIKRCVRIYPLYWLLSLCVIPVYFLVPSFGKGHEQDIGVIIKSLLLIPQEHPPILSVAWFLSHLVLFYLAFTAVILLPKVASKLILAGLSVSAVFMLTDILSGFQLRNNNHFLLNFIFSYYNFEFAGGWLIGIFFRRIQLKKSVSLWILLTGCCTFMMSGLLDVYILQTSANNSGFAHYYEFVAYGLSSILIVGGAAFLEKDHKLSVSKGFVVLGTASFSIYLTHYLILSIFTKVIQVIGINSIGFYTIGMMLACVATVLIGCIIHFYVEKRLASIFKNRLAYKRA
ncbi:acyltransferase [Leptothoe sp. ISB3NOV94-8A]